MTLLAPSVVLSVSMLLVYNNSLLLFFVPTEASRRRPEAAYRPPTRSSMRQTITVALSLPYTPFSPFPPYTSFLTVYSRFFDATQSQSITLIIPLFF